MRGREGNPFLTGSVEKPAPKKPRPTKQATVYAAEQNLKPWEVKRPRATPSGPISDVGMETRRRKTVVAPKPKPTSLNTRYRAALAAPVNAPIGKRKVPARELLAGTMSAQRRQQYLHSLLPPAPRRDTSFLHALTQTPKSMLENITGGGRAVGETLFGGPYLGQGPLGGVVPTKREFHEVNKSLVGRALYNDITQGKLEHPLAALTEGALLALPAGLKAAPVVARGARAVGESAVVRRLVAEETGTLDPTARFGKHYQAKVVHITTPESAAAIRKHGFDVSRGKGIGGDHYGPGVYLADEARDMGAFWRSQLETKGETGTVPTEAIGGHVSLRKPFRYEYNRYSRDGRILGTISPRQALAKERSDLLAPFDAAAKTTTERQVLGKVLRENGYDGLVVHHRQGDEIVAFDPSAVAFGAPPSPLRRLLEEETGAFDPGARFRETPLPKAKPPTPATAKGVEEGGQVLMKGMGRATRLRREQQQLRSQEQGVRTAEYRRIMEEGGHTDEAKARAMRALAGPLPKLRWDRFTEMDPDTVDAMVHHIRTHPALQGANKTYTRINTEQALHRITMGLVPRKFEQKLLRDVFGDQATDQMLSSIGFWKKNRARLLNVIGIPRSLLSSFDLSAPFRQGLVFGTTHPVLFSKNFRPMLRAFRSPRIYEEVQAEIAARPNFDLYEAGGLPFTDLGADISRREEAFMSSYAETLTGGKASPVRASNRAYVAFLNKSRADYMDWLIEQAEKTHPELDWESPEGTAVLKNFGRIVGNATGRGKFPGKTLQNSMPLLNATLFSPRLLASRLDVLSYPASTWTLHPVARKEALKQLGSLSATVTGVLGLAYLAGARVSRDPTNADFGKVRVGNTRFDIAGGFLQPVRLVAQLEQNRITSSVTGEKLQLGTGKFGSKSRLSIVARFLETKESPPAGIIVDWARGTDFENKPFSVQREAYQRLVPLLMQDSREFYNEGDKNSANAALAMAVYGIGMWGIGTQTYTPKPTGGGVPGGTGNPFLSGGVGGSSGSNPFLSGSVGP